MYNWLSHGIVGNSVCRTWESCTLAFPCAVNRVIHDSIACYAHFHDACLLVFGFFGADRAVLWNEVEKIGKAKNALFQVQGEETADRSRENQKERLQYLAAGTAGTATPQKTGYGEITDRAAG